MADQKTERMSEKRRPKEFSLSSPFFSSCSILPARHGLLESRVPSTTNCPGFPLPRRSLESASSLLGSALSVDASTQMDTDLPGKGHDTRKKRRPFFLFPFLLRRSIHEDGRAHPSFFRDPCGCSSDLSLSDSFTFLRLKLTPFCTLDRNLSTQKERRVSGPKRQNERERKKHFSLSPVKESVVFHHADPCEPLRERQQQARLRRCLCPWQRALDVGGLVL